MTTTQTLIEAVNNASSAIELLKSVRNLAQQKDPQAIDTLIAVLGYNNPGAAVAAVDGLVALGEVAVPPLLKQIDTYNYGARAWAVRVFAQIGDPQTLDLLIHSATNDFSQSVRRAAAKGLGNIVWSKLSQEEKIAAQQKALDTLLITLQDGEWIVRYAGIVALQSLALASCGDNPEIKAKIETILPEFATNEPEITIRARIAMALS